MISSFLKLMLMVLSIINMSSFILMIFWQLWKSQRNFYAKNLAQGLLSRKKSIGPPLQYLGNKVSQVTLANGVTCWSFSSSQYIQNAVNNVENYLLKQGEKKLPHTKSPWPSNYRPEIDVSPVLSPGLASYYQSLIGILR